ncbi:MAG: hypothetical protein ACI92O_001121 [Colwellia sp.]|jgi:hypothetical protein
MNKILAMLKPLYSSLKVFDNYPKVEADNVILFGCHDVNRSMIEKGECFSPILEGVKSLVEQDGFTFVNLTHPFAILNNKSIKGGSVTVNYRFLWMRIKLFLMSRVCKKDYETYRIELEEAFYNSMLTQLKPQIVFSLQPPLAFCRAARKMGIKVVELMHFNNISLKDKIFVKHLSIADELLPNIILSFDKCSYDTVSTLTQGRDIKSFYIEDAWYNYLKFKGKDSKESEMVISLTGDYDVKVLISLQWGYDGERDSLSNIIPNGILHPQIEKVISAEKNKNILFLIRLHPIQRLRPWYKHHVDYINALVSKFPNVEVDISSSVPLHFLLEDVNFHITMSSSCVGEAALAKVPSLLLCPSLHIGGENYGLFRELESEGGVEFGVLDDIYIQNWLKKARVDDEHTNYDTDEIRRSLKEFYLNLINK